MSDYLNNIGVLPYNYINSNANYGNGFSLSNYTDMSTTSIFEGQNMNTGYYSQMSPQMPQQDNSTAFFEQLILTLLSAVLQKQNTNSNGTTFEETIIDDTDGIDTEQSRLTNDKNRPTIEKILDPIGITKNDDRSTIKKILDPGGIFKGW